MRYSDWLKNANSAQIFRDAFAAVDQIPIELRLAHIELLHRQSEKVYQERLIDNDPEIYSKPSSNEKIGKKNR